MKLRKTPIASAVAIVLMSAALNVQAQDADPKELDAVQVKGIRGAIEKSLDTKREEDTRVEVITSEDIGKMPDKNVADSLQRVAGVNISAASANEGAFDENDRVSMRGTSPSLTQTLLNGHNVASGDWFVLNQTGTVGRSVSYSLLPSELVDKVVVKKSSEASLVEGGAVGSIDIITRKPLQFADNFTGEASLGVVYADQPGTTDPQLSALANWKNDAGTAGIMVQAFSEQRHLRRDGQELLGYDTIKANDAAGIAHADLIGVYYPVLIGSALFEQERKRSGGLISAEFKPSDTTTLGFTYFTSNLDAANYNRNYMLWGSRIIQGGLVPDAGYVVKDNTLVNAEFSPVAGRQYGIYDQISRPDSSSNSSFFTFDAAWNPSEKLSLSIQVGTSDGNGKTPTQDVAEWDVGFGSGAGWSLNGIGAADWHLGSTNTSQPGTPGTDMRLDWIFGFQDVDVEDKEDWVQFDGEYFIDNGSLSSLQFGVRNAEHSRELGQVTAQGPACIDQNGNVVGFDWGSSTFCPAGTRSPFDPANWPSGYKNYPGDFASGLGGSYPRDIWYYSPDQLAQFNEMTNRDPVSRYYFPASYNLEEGSTAAYAQLNFKGDSFSGNIGLRWVQTREDITNYVNASALDPDAITTSLFGPYKTLVTEHTYDNFLPSANLRWNINDELVARFAAAQTLTRADYSALAGSVSLSPPAVPGGTGTGSGGNPDLKPITSTNIDATLEWYFAPRSLVSGSVFYMDIENYIALGQETKSYFTIDQNNPQGTYVDYLLTVPVNSNAKVSGIELAWEQAFGEHWGGFANYTYADGSTDDGTDMLGTSENTFNVGGYFENEKFNARLNYSYRSEFYSGLDRATAFYQDAVDTVSASFGYKINDNFAVTLDGLNLNNPKTAYYAESKERPRSIYENGRQYYLTLRMKF
jgi:iron complex outermembrane receptor protein